MTPRIRDNFGLGGPGATVRWKGTEPETRTNWKKKERLEREKRAPTKLTRPKPLPVGTCLQPTCSAWPNATPVPDRRVCQSCAERLVELSAEVLEHWDFRSQRSRQVSS